MKDDKMTFQTLLSITFFFFLLFCNHICNVFCPSPPPRHTHSIFVCPPLVAPPSPLLIYSKPDITQVLQSEGFHWQARGLSGTALEMYIFTHDLHLTPRKSFLEPVPYVFFNQVNTEWNSTTVSFTDPLCTLSSFLPGLYFFSNGLYFLSSAPRTTYFWKITVVTYL